jgi:hypothetical protein
MSDAAPSPLAFLEKHFDSLKPREVEIEGFPFKLLFEPLNAEQTFKYVAAAKARTPGEQSRLFAELIVETVKTEDGKQAFPLVKGGPNPVEVLTKKTPPAIFSKLVENLGKEAPAGEAEEVEKK